MPTFMSMEQAAEIARANGEMFDPVIEQARRDSIIAVCSGTAVATEGIVSSTAEPEVTGQHFDEVAMSSRPAGQSWEAWKGIE